MFSSRKVRVGIRQKTSLWNTEQMKALCIQPSTFPAEEAALPDSTREPLQKTDSKGAKGETKVTPWPETSGRSSLEIHRQQIFTAPHECAEHKYSKGKKGRPADPDRACASVHNTGIWICTAQPVSPRYSQSNFGS